MKLVREHIYEKFTKDSDPVYDMGIGQRHLIIKWFEDLERQLGYKIDYEIDDDLHIFVKEALYLNGLNITKLPDNLYIEGSLNLDGTQIKELPNNLTIGAWLDLQGSNITKLPNDLKVRGEIYKDF